MTPNRPVQPSCLDPGSPIDVKQRIVIGTCGACQRPIKIKPVTLTTHLRPMTYTCSCGGVTAISYTFDQARALAEAWGARLHAAFERAGLEASTERSAPPPADADASATVHERKHGSAWLSPEQGGAHVGTPTDREDLNRQLRDLAAAAPANEAEIIQGLLVHPEYPDQDKRKRLAAVGELKHVLSERTLPALKLALQDPIDDVAYAVVGVLEALREVGSLAELLRDERLSVHAACALGRTDDAAAVPPLADAWERRAGDPLARSAAAQALADIGGPGARPTMLKLLEHQESHVRRIGLRALQKDGSEEAVAGIRTLLRKDRELRREAIEALGEMRASSALHDLVEQLDSREDWVAGDAAQALGKIGDARAQDPLSARLDKLDPDDPDRDRFVDAIRRLSGSRGASRGDHGTR